jgi:hypothetical protein
MLSRPVLAGVLAGVLALLAACSDLPAPGPYPGGLSPKGEVLAGAHPRGGTVQVIVTDTPAGADDFARAFLNGLQVTSFAERREFCGYFYLDAAGNFAASPAARGTFAECEYDLPPRGGRVFASYHTHGAFGADYDNEVPSVTDLLSDFDFGIDGYVATPGGRLWKVDYAAQRTYQVCGLGCVLVDPGFQPRNESTVRSSYTLGQLQNRANQF